MEKGAGGSEGQGVTSIADRCPDWPGLGDNSAGVEDAADAEWAAKGLQRISQIVLPSHHQMPPSMPEGSWAPRITTALVLQDGQLARPNHVTLLKLFKGDI